MAREIRNNWTREEISEIYNLPLMDLIFEAAKTHRENFDGSEVQMSTLLSIKTGGCPDFDTRSPRGSCRERA